MPKIDMEAYKNAETSVGGDFARMEPGGYVVRVQKVVTEWRNSAGSVKGAVASNTVRLVYDIADGPLAGKFSDGFWIEDESKDRSHCAYLSWSNMGAFKSNVEAFEESNQGFDFMAAFTADKWELLIGKEFGIVVGGEEYISGGEVKVGLTLPRIKSSKAIRDGRYRVPDLVKLDRSSESSSTATVSNSSPSVPVFK